VPAEHGDSVRDGLSTLMEFRGRCDRISRLAGTLLADCDNDLRVNRSETDGL